MTTWAISGKRVLTERGWSEGTVHIAAGRIVAIEPRRFADRAVDVGDLAVMPGVVDTHVHVNEPGRTEWEGFASAGRAAAAGGVTTMVVMPLNCTPAATSAAALRAEADAAARSCLVDYGFWGGVVPGNDEQLRGLWTTGVLGFKCFLVHSGVDDFPNVGEQDLELAMPILRELSPGGAPLLVHAEDPEVIAGAHRVSGLEHDRRSYRAYLRSRPPQAEVVAIERMIDLCQRCDGRVHIVHVAAAEAIPALRAARREGLRITAETCPHYLTFTSEAVPDGATEFKCAPPIRDTANREALWRALRDGDLDLVASDHSPCPPELKRRETGDFEAAWGGISSLELTLPVTWTGASARGVPLEDVSRWLSGGPARLAGIDDSKGSIAPGQEADLVVFDPDAQWTVRASSLHHRHPITPYDGARLRGRVMATIVRGRPVYASESVPDLRGEVGADGLATEVKGRWVKRKSTDWPT